jgi:hypothetical protein
MTDKWVVDPETGKGELVPLTPEEEAQHAADQAQGHQRRLQQSQGAADDTERLRTINDRARTDPAYAALADIVLRGLSR